MTDAERRILSLRAIPPTEIAALKRKQHARLSRMIAKLSECIAAVPLAELADPDVAAVVEVYCEERELLERCAYSMAIDFVELEVGACG